MVQDEAVSYVNAPVIAAERGLTVVEEGQRELSDWQSALRLTGEVDGRRRTVSGTFMAKKGPVLTEVDGYEIEVPLTEHMLLLRNRDLPGVIGRVGSYLGSLAVNIANMVVGRSPEGEAAMMGLSLDQPMDDDAVSGLLAVEGILAARYIDLT
jgi:D-3-phosphoglycerate dehydrogenase